MANSYTQIHIQAIFVVKNRQSLINKSIEDELFKYITGIIQNQGHKMLAINGMPDHIHLFFGLKPKQSLSDLMKIVKRDSSIWLNKQNKVTKKFSWQSGFAAFSYSLSQVPSVARYIQNQKEHHRKKAFFQEYIEFLEKFEIEYNEKYLFHPVE